MRVKKEIKMHFIDEKKSEFKKRTFKLPTHVQRDKIFTTIQKICIKKNRKINN